MAFKCRVVHPIYKDEEIQIVLDEHTKKLSDAKGYSLKYHNSIIEYYNELREWNKSRQTNV